MDSRIYRQVSLYRMTLIFSVVIALIGFSYNVWRMEVTEKNSTIRTASFEILIHLSELEQLVYIAHYDQDLKEGSPRKGWVVVGLVNDLSVLTDPSITASTAQLKDVWSNHWQSLSNDQVSADAIVESIDVVRDELKQLLTSLD